MVIAQEMLTVMLLLVVWLQLIQLLVVQKKRYFKCILKLNF